jgi:uncharacterized protein YceK
LGWLAWAATAVPWMVGLTVSGCSAMVTVTVAEEPRTRKSTKATTTTAAPIP